LREGEREREIGSERQKEKKRKKKKIEETKFCREIRMEEVFASV
jgi:hypothetical protein